MNSEAAGTEWIRTCVIDIGKEICRQAAEQGVSVRFESEGTLERIIAKHAPARNVQPSPDDIWDEFIVKDMCSLCGQLGIVDTRGIKTPAGFECGGLHYCICPNGRALKAKNADKEAWLSMQARPVPQPAIPMERLKEILRDPHLFDGGNIDRAANRILMAVPQPATEPDELSDRLLKKYGVECGVTIDQGKFANRIVYAREFTAAIQEALALRDVPQGQTDEQLVIDLARELYDRFLMGGWTPEDAYPQIRAMLAARQVPVPSEKEKG